MMKEGRWGWVKIAIGIAFFVACFSLLGMELCGYTRTGRARIDCNRACTAQGWLGGVASDGSCYCNRGYRLIDK